MKVSDNYFQYALISILSMINERIEIKIYSEKTRQ